MLDKTLRYVPLQSDRKCMQIVRLPGFEWEITCDTDHIDKNSNFSCTANVDRVKMVFFRTEYVG